MLSFGNLADFRIEDDFFAYDSIFIMEVTNDPTQMHTGKEEILEKDFDRKI